MRLLQEAHQKTTAPLHHFNKHRSALIGILPNMHISAALITVLMTAATYAAPALPVALDYQDFSDAVVGTILVTPSTLERRQGQCDANTCVSQMNRCVMGCGTMSSPNW